MNHTIKRIRAMLIITAILTVAFSALCATCNLLYFEPETSMYAASGAILLKIFYVASALTSVSAAVFCFAFKKDLSCITLPQVPPALRVIEKLGGVIFLIGAVLRTTLFMMDETKYSLNSAIVTLILFALIFSSLYMIFSKKTELFGMIGAIALVIDVMEIYSDMTQPIASEYKIMTAIYTTFILLYWLAEIRMKIAEPQPLMYIGLMIACLTVSGSVCIGRAIYLASGNLPLGNDPARTVCGFGFTLYLIAKSIALWNAPVQEQTAPEPDPEESPSTSSDTSVCTDENVESLEITETNEVTPPTDNEITDDTETTVSDIAEEETLLSDTDDSADSQNETSERTLE